MAEYLSHTFICSLVSTTAYSLLKPNLAWCGLHFISESRKSGTSGLWQKCFNGTNVLFFWEHSNCHLQIWSCQQKLESGFYLSDCRWALNPPLSSFLLEPPPVSKFGPGHINHTRSEVRILTRRQAHFSKLLKLASEEVKWKILIKMFRMPAYSSKFTELI